MKNNELDNILKEELMKNIQFDEAEKADKPKAAKVYGKIGGLTNLGRTYFISSKEVDKANEKAQFAIAQKYGKDIYGQGGSLISCKVGYFLQVQAKANEASGEASFKGCLENVAALVKKQTQEWQNEKQDDIAKLSNMYKSFKEEDGPASETNKQVGEGVAEILKRWSEENPNTWSGLLDSTAKSWKVFLNGDNASKNSNQLKTFDSDKAVKSKDVGWDPNASFRIDIKTNFTPDWFKHQFKSGLLNKALFAFKTDIMSKTTDAAKDHGHKYTADEMLPQDERKLDSIKWKMTNKVTKDYITLLLGWSRKKEKYADSVETGIVPNELKEDTGFGGSMAKAAMGGRGIFGRLKQKLFAGGQDSDAISVCFQLADPNDGSWKLVKKPEDANTKKADKDQEEKDSGKDDEQAPETNDSDENEEMNESTIDPFEGLFDDSSTLKFVTEDRCVESERYGLVKEVCGTRSKASVAQLVDNCILGKIYK